VPKNVEGGHNDPTLGLDGLIHAVAFRNQHKTVAQAREIAARRSYEEFGYGIAYG
jgi:hypothetical protein